MKITANHVTLTRMVFLPIPSALVLWGDPVGMIVALVVGIIIGATDALDGWMARRDGPTVLGALLDPTADKLFMAALLLPLSAQGYCPGWVAGGIFARELLITGLRTSMEIKEERLKTSTLGKLKTVVQMGGLAVFYFTAFLPDAAVVPVHAAGTLVLVVILLVFVLGKRRRAPFWVEGSIPLWGAIAGLSAVMGREATIAAIFWIMLALTWGSGLDYLVGAYRVFRQRGAQPGDWARIAWALGHGLLVAAVLTVAREAVIPVMIVLAGELSVGGIDNVVSAERHKGARAPFALSGALALILGLAILLLPAVRGTVAIAAVSALGVLGAALAARAFMADREVFR